MADDGPLKKCSLYVIQYVPDLVRGESINIGVLLHSPRENYLGCLLTDDFRRIKRFHAHADLELLRELQHDFEKQIDDAESELQNYLHNTLRSYANLIQLSEPRACALADPQGELAEIFARYVGGHAIAPQSSDTRLHVKQKLTAALSVAGVWDKLEKRIPASRWTHPDDPFAFDYGYKALLVNGKPNGHLHFIHALSLRRDAELAKILVYTLDRIRRKERANLTAVVEAWPAAGDNAADLSRQILEDGEIALQPIARVAEFVEGIRRDLLM